MSSRKPTCSLIDHPPVRVMKADDQTVAELALLENLQREDLNPIEEAEAYRRMMEEFGMTEEELARKMGMKQTWRIRERTDLLRLHVRYRKMHAFLEIRRSSG